MEKIIITLSLLASLANAVHGQVRGVVVDKETALPVPFATVSCKGKDGEGRRGVVANVQGEFFIADSSVTALTVSHLGYRPTTVALGAIRPQPLVVALEEHSFSIGDVVVTPKNNPALRIIQSVLDNRERNDFERYGSYSYRCYFKTTADLQIPSVLSAADSAKLKSIDIFERATLISETVTLCRKSGSRAEDEIVATRTSGMETPLFGQTCYSLFHKAISFYSHSIQILGESESGMKMVTDYVSPLSSSGAGGYRFHLESEYVADGDTIFEISYFPKKHRNFNSLMGTLFISSNGYAPTCVIAKPYEKGAIDFKFKQEYELVSGRWFPKKLAEEIGFVRMRLIKGSSAYLAYIISSQIDSVSFGAPQKPLRSLDRVYLSEADAAQSRSVLNSVRPEPLSPREERTYSFTDSVFGKRHQLDAFANSIAKMDEGKLSFRKVDVNLLRVYGFNEHEGSRWGLGLHTNERLNKVVAVGGYVGYGIRDKRAKYGGEVELTLNRSRSAKVTYSYQNTLKGAGSSMDFSLAGSYGRNVVASRFEYCTEHKAGGYFHVLPSLQAGASLSVRDFTPAYEYSYAGRRLLGYKADELSLFLRYARGEKYMSLGAHRVLTSIGNPVFYATCTRGVDFLRRSSYTYSKLEVSASILAYNGRIGQSTLLLEGGYVDRNLPYGLLFTGEGSYDEQFSFVIAKTFQTMRPDEFLSDKYAHVFYTHNFGSLLFKSGLLRPELLATYNAGWGSIGNASSHGIAFRVKNHLYQEAGVIVDNIVRLPVLNVMYLRFGAGGFTRLGYYQYTKFEDNVALKMSITFSFK
ncbi:MAG: DUF5686 and carboxypeptidase regulatory-like domain-containing protein [Prevotellaceae bacterium]|nr:DUF5686 and carboxypeptidase regulatory-like domain-containing protein [Prevotellaceae bacterium]